MQCKSFWLFIHISSFLFLSSFCRSVTLMLSAYVIRQIQIPFGRYTRCVQCYCVRWDHGLPGQGEICGSNPQPKQAVCLLLAFKQICCLIHQVAALINVSGFRQITLMLVVAKSWWIAVRRESD